MEWLLLWYFVPVYGEKVLEHCSCTTDYIQEMLWLVVSHKSLIYLKFGDVYDLMRPWQDPRAARDFMLWRNFCFNS